ncbi:hypothetical protein D3C87_1549650 [compost metagenome]
MIELAERQHFDVVVLSAAWFTTDWTKLSTTLSALHKLGVPKVQVVGPLPYWEGGLPRQLLIEYSRTGTFPQRMHRGLSDEIASLDTPLRQLVEAQGAEFLSPIGAMCSDAGCLTIEIPGELKSLIAWDTGHLTSWGATELVSLLYPRRAANL